MKKILGVIGTRPDAIKMAPVILELQRSDDVVTKLYSTGQHKEMLAQVLQTFNLKVDGDFGVMKAEQSLAYLTSSILTALDGVLEAEKPDIVVAQGDTTTTLVAGLASFYRRIPLAHVEAGLRTDSVDSPFPEEFNRRAVGQTARLHFAPTKVAAANLLAERADPTHVFVTGNTSIDAVLNIAGNAAKPAERLILVTTHRRENWGEPQRNVCKAIVAILDKAEGARVVVPMHKNPVVREVLLAELGSHPRVSLIEPPEYAEFVKLMANSYLILTDSGGVQEEAPALGKPVLVLRSETERPEGIAAGNALLVGTDQQCITREALKLLDDDMHYASMAQARNPYGDGLAAKRIVAQLRKFLGLGYDELAPFEG